VDTSTINTSDVTELWIGSELVKFSHFEGNWAMNCQRGASGTSPAAHVAGTAVSVSGAVYQIPAHNDIESYMNNLRTAFNDPGLSLVDSSSVYHDGEFIRQNG
jgi:hypothetical protein